MLNVLHKTHYHKYMGTENDIVGISIETLLLLYVD